MDGMSKHSSIVRRRAPEMDGCGVGKPVENSAMVEFMRESRSGRVA
jgi:hypothetical protein